LNRLEAIETDKKERPKVSIKIEDCLVFVDPYLEVDEKIKNERASSIKEKKAEQSAEAKKAGDSSEDKVLRQGVGKYIDARALDKKQKLSNVEDENDKAELKSKKMKAATTTSFENFSNW